MNFKKTTRNELAQLLSGAMNVSLNQARKYMKDKKYTPLFSKIKVTKEQLGIPYEAWDDFPIYSRKYYIKNDDNISSTKDNKVVQ